MSTFYPWSTAACAGSCVLACAQALPLGQVAGLVQSAYALLSAICTDESRQMSQVLRSSISTHPLLQRRRMRWDQQLLQKIAF